MERKKNLSWLQKKERIEVNYALTDPFDLTVPVIFMVFMRRTMTASKRKPQSFHVFFQRGTPPCNVKFS